jgi:hypothetical protein
VIFNSIDDFQRADWPLLQNGAVNLFWRQAIYEDAQVDLEALGYEVAKLTCRKGVESFKLQLSSALEWRDRFGYEPWDGNFDALHDALRFYPFGASKRSVIAIDGYQDYVKADRQRSSSLLDLLEASARDHLLLGKTLIILIQTDDATYVCNNIGGRSAQWNNKEWLNSSRGL